MKEMIELLQTEHYSYFKTAIMMDKANKDNEENIFNCSVVSLLYKRNAKNLHDYFLEIKPLIKKKRNGDEESKYNELFIKLRQCRNIENFLNSLNVLYKENAGILAKDFFSTEKNQVASAASQKQYGFGKIRKPKCVKNLKEISKREDA